MKVVVLVPWRGGDAEREATWDVVRPHLETYGWQVIAADSRGPWSRAAALNEAAKRVSTFDVAVVADADTIHGEDCDLAGAVEAAHELGSAIVPWSVRWRLSAAASRDITATIATFDPKRDLDPTDGFAHNDRIARYPTWRVGSTIVISRAAWDATGGFDAGFVTWGYEDCAHRLAVTALAPGGLDRTAGTIWHLHHDHDPRAVSGNRQRFGRYRKASQPREMRRLLEDLGVT